jgi:hypothetical protein
MFRSLLAHPQQALYNQNMVYWVRVMSAVAASVLKLHFNSGAANMLKFMYSMLVNIKII